jgi:3-phytase
VTAAARIRTALAVALLVLAGCERTPAAPAPSISESVEPFAETPSLTRGSGDAADDAAIHPEGYVIGTSKDAQGGLEVYDLRARRLQWVGLGMMNNVDLRGSTVAATNRTRRRVELLSFEDGRLEPTGSFDVPFEPYGVCLYRDTVVVSAHQQGRVAQYSLDGELLRELRGIAAQSEGCVADDERGVLYIGEESRGVWRFDAAPDASAAGALIAEVGPDLANDVEGLALARGHLIASSQGDSSFAVYRDDRFVGRFRVQDNGDVDAVSRTDGIAASTELDLLIVHDAENDGGTSSNYKFVRLSEVFSG